MASPPFVIDETLPGDSDLISQHPSGARTFRDVVESWLLTISDTSGVILASALTAISDGAGNISSGAITSALSDLGVGLPGMISAYAASSAPTGWLLCEGQNVSRTTYAALFAVIGTTYGVGDGSTTFGIPDLRERVVAGWDRTGGISRLTGLSGGVNGDTLGNVGGSQSHTLTLAQLAAHNHGGVTGNQSPSDVLGGINVENNGTPGTANALMRGQASSGSIGQGQIYNVPSHTHSIPSAGSDSAHNNVQPTIILNYIIKT